MHFINKSVSLLNFCTFSHSRKNKSGQTASMMKKLLPFFVLLLCPFLQQTVKAQDPHFTQFFSSPLTLNPAYTGLFTGDLRVAANYRSQWAAIALPYVTGTVSADFGILKNTIPYNDRWGVGGIAMYDRQAGGGLKTTYIGFSTAYHKGLNREGSQSLAVGFQASFAQKRLDYSKLVFENQLTNLGFDPTVPSGEYFANSTVSYPDFNVGVLYNASLGTFGNLYAGASYYHINQPDQSFLKARKAILHNRWTIHGGGGWAPTPKTRIYLSGLYMQQAGAYELAAGGAVGFVLNNDPMDADLLFLGSWFRLNDAINPYVGVDLDRLHIGLSYDINISSLNAASNYRGGAELSLVYIFKKSNTKTINCPRF